MASMQLHCKQQLYIYTHQTRTFCLLEPNSLTFSKSKYRRSPRVKLFLINVNDIFSSSNILSFVLFSDDSKYMFIKIQLMERFKSLTQNLPKQNNGSFLTHRPLMSTRLKLMVARKKNLYLQGKVILRNDAIQRVTKAKILDQIVDQHLYCKEDISIYQIMWHCITSSKYF